MPQEMIVKDRVRMRMVPRKMVEIINSIAIASEVHRRHNQDHVVNRRHRHRADHNKEAFQAAQMLKLHYFDTLCE